MGALVPALGAGVFPCLREGAVVVVNSFHHWEEYGDSEGIRLTSG